MIKKLIRLKKRSELSFPADSRLHVDLASKRALQRKMKGCTIQKQRKREYIRIYRGKSPLCSEAALFNFTCKRYGQFNELFSSRSTLSFSLSF